VGSFEASQQAVRAYQLHRLFTSEYALPDWFYTGTEIVGVALPLIEIVIGLLLITGTFTRVAAIIGGLMMVAFIFAIASVWARGISIDCGCFGNGGEVEASQTAYPEEILRDVGLLICGAWAAWKPKSPLSVDNWLQGNTTTVIDAEDDEDLEDGQDG
jgi:uncharacterized membrane protein YphA (DoxX/SURF4 family)